ncbi:M23 family metallopeptidase [Candidatus Uhrbacteria bacterium]|nr:M23 family metallopeptidase [Candidatus Uhrbacteria bacterium]
MPWFIFLISVLFQTVHPIFQPMESASERILYKSLGTQVSPSSSPVQPERFRGYHTGTDFEVFDHERDADVAVFAICTGTLLRKTTASGYGGYAVQSCKINGQDVTVVYGHLRLSSIAAAVGDEIIAGEKIAVLGTGYSKETDGERKHLHLSIKKGKTIDIRGYVQAKSELDGWIDYESLMK